MTPPPENGLTVERVTGLRDHWARETRFCRSHDLDPMYSESMLALCEAWLAAQEPKGGDARDAARYRWLRDNQTREALKSTNSRNSYRAMDICTEAFGEQWDSLIDAAMAPPNTHEGEG